jgi:hypothetical protein
LIVLNTIGVESVADVKREIARARWMAESRDCTDIRERTHLLESVGRGQASIGNSQGLAILRAVEKEAGGGSDPTGELMSIRGQELVLAQQRLVDQEQIRFIGQRGLAIAESKRWRRTEEQLIAAARQGGVALSTRVPYEAPASADE